MKNKTNLLLIFAMLFSITFASVALAQETAVAKSNKAIENQNSKNANVVKNQAGTEDTEATTDDSQGKKDKLKENKGQITAQEHRSVVANFVQGLLAVADREGGIGQEVRAIAQQQNDTKDRTADLINAVESRSKIKTFFIGTSYKNLGELRSQMVQTRNQIDQLKKIVDRANNEQDKTELQTQIQTLQQQQAGINSFIVQNENKFSLFGWAVKLFNK